MKERPVLKTACVRSVRHQPMTYSETVGKVAASTTDFTMHRVYG